MRGFELEWQRQRPLLVDSTVVSIYFGGGTPFLLGADSIGLLIERVKRDLPCVKDLEITLEANPENVTYAHMQAFQAAGINRVSIGIQTFEEALLKRLGRLHSIRQSEDAVYATYEAGIQNISVDLMYDLPGQTNQGWQWTLERAAQLPITHLSLYNLTIEPHTVFFKYRQDIEKQQPDAESSLKMYQEACIILESAGLKAYEISAFERGGHPSRHNTGYWLGREFLGFGPSAFSYWDKSRFRNVAHLGKYVQRLEAGESPIDFSEQLDQDAQRRELLVIALRMRQGVCLDEFQKKYGLLEKGSIDGIHTLCQEGLLIQEGSLLKLSPRGILFYDTVASDLV